jgi:hypothetical protein
MTSERDLVTNVVGYKDTNKSEYKTVNKKLPT